mmetsp:Transcript_25367/g.62428  ORF Transcript_25367/g.62428 Transcript_25367/m.62428 type:complete len:320 (-) Transcript_25367:167-1126(-)|eukprot:CAMPEP_0113629712 /NCGR_PEP_ID=MMETSP0017_2-20120614/15427_1 /TAXON_ID=2856 /ORGANISM="Cylindrotheca closterium" /LENGTH=319 /DNA_ID=CAMNT_0000540127 /DNA_START=146 /DNA_END=1105 /DNA_ORIENTATION=- /assembly_acc=CAM_ASM_000147
MAKVAPYKLHLFKLLLLLLLVTISSSEDDVCSVEGECPEDEAPPEEVKGVCPRPSRTIYSQGGTAQAYKPNAPLSSTVCEAESAQQYKYKRASWNFSRRTFRKGTAPELDITLRFNSCSKGDSNQCQCYKVEGPSSPSDRVEVWQTRPDGRYSSLRSSDECRAQVQMNDQGEVKFTTLAPGSSGLMGGLGPSGFDWSPYGPPVIHMLVQVTGHSPILLDVPMLFRIGDLTQHGFSLGDWRGQGWMKYRPRESVLTLTSWEPNVEENRIAIEYEISLQQVEGEKKNSADLCESYLKLLPSAFYLEPIATCSKSIMDFFAV